MISKVISVPECHAVRLVFRMTLSLNYFLPPLPKIRKVARKGVAGCNVSWSSRETVLDERGKWDWKETVVSDGMENKELKWSGFRLLA